jgi:WD40 repeat protein
LADVFVSYAREDQATVRRLHEALAARDREAWVDWEGIEPSDRWMESIREAIDAADAVVFVISPDSLASDVCRQELGRAIEVNKRLIPLVARGVPAGSAPSELAELNWIFAREGKDDFELAADAVIRALETDIDLVRTHTLVLTRAHAWELGGRRASPLLRGEELRRAEEWVSRAAAGARPRPTELQAAFVAASRRTARRRQRIAVAGSLAVAALSIGLAIVALVSRSQAIHESHVAQGQALTAESSASLSSDPELSLLLAREALARDASPAAKLALITAFDQTTVTAIYRRPPGVLGVAWDPRGREVAAAGQDGSVALWDPAASRVARTFRADRHAVDAVAWSPDGTVLACAGADDEIHLWNPTSGRLLRSLPGHTKPVRALAFSADGRYLISGSDDSTARVWNASTGQLIHTVTGQTGSIVGVAILPGDQYVVTASNGDGHTLVWSTRTWQVVSSYRPGLHSQLPNAVALSRDGGLVAMAGGDGIVRLWNLRTGKIVRTFSTEPLAPFLAVTFSRDGRLLAAGGLDDRAHVWNVSDGRLVQTYPGDRSVVDGVSFSPDGKLLVSAGGDGTARAWSVPGSSRALLALRKPPLAVPVLSAGAVDPTGNLVVAAGPDGNVHAYRVLGGAQVWQRRVDTVDRGPNGLAFGSEGRSIAVATSHGVSIVRASNGSLARTFPGPASHGAAFSPGETLVASAGADRRLRIYDVARSQPTLTLPTARAGGDIYSVAISPDGSLLAAGMQDGTVRLWRLPGGSADGVLRGPSGPVLDIAFTRDGKSLVGGSADKRAWLWSVPGGRVERTFQGHAGGVGWVAISPDGRYLATASDDHTARIWDLRTGATVRVLAGDTDWVTTIGFSSDGRELVTTSADATLRTWQSCWFCDSTSALLKHVQPALVRCLTPDETETYLHRRQSQPASCAA